MKRRTRNLILLFFLIIFIFSCPFVILYCKGYRLDFENRSLIKTGAIFIKAKPGNYKIYLDEELIKETNFLFNSTFIKKLLPGEYNIKVKRNGYFTWEKNLEVKEERVEEARNILLFPKDPKKSLFLSDIEYFSVKENNLIIIKEYKEEKFIESINLKENKKTTLLKESSLEKELLNPEIVLDQNLGIIFVSLSEKDNFIVAENTIYSLNNLGEIKEISFNPFNQDEIILVKEDNLLKYNYKTGARKIIFENILTYKIFNDNVFCLSKEGLLYKNDFEGNIVSVLNKNPINTEKSEYKLDIENEKYILLKQDEELLILLNDSFESIGKSVKNTRISPDQKKLLMIDGGEIWIMFLEDIEHQPFRKEGEKIFLMRSLNKNCQVHWLNSNYLITSNGKEISIIEIDNRDRINSAKIGEFENAEIVWIKELEKLYIFSSNNVYLIEGLLP